MDAAMRIGSGGHQRATVQAVILCGGFGGDLVNDVLHEIGSVRDTRRANYYRSLLDGGPGEEHITEALVPVHRASALYHLLLSMESSRRLHPLDRNVFVVCNEANRGLSSLRRIPPLREGKGKGRGRSCCVTVLRPRLYFHQSDL